MPKWKRVEVLMPESLYANFKKHVQKEGLTVGTKIKALVVEYLNRGGAETQKLEGEAEK